MPSNRKKLYSDIAPPRKGEKSADSPEAVDRTPVDPRELGTIGRDDLGNAIWEWRVNVRNRRPEDPTIDLLECLDVDGMSIEDEAGDEEPLDKGVFNPYDKTR